MAKVIQNHMPREIGFRRDNVRYKTHIPSRELYCSLSEIAKEIRENNFGSLSYNGEKGKWEVPIINVEMKHAASPMPIWEVCGSGFRYARKDYEEVVSIAVIGYNERQSDYYTEHCETLNFFVVPANEDTANGELSKLSLKCFEDYPQYYEITKNTDKTFIFRCPNIIKRYALSLSTHPMMLPWEYLMQEFYQGLYVGEMVEDAEGIIEERLPVVRFWVENEGERIPQYYTYEEEIKYIKRGSEPTDWICEVKLKKVDPKNVKQEDEWFFVNKKFHIPYTL